MEFELIQLTCNKYEGVMLYKLEDYVVKFVLCTPAFNDYSEYQIYCPETIEDYEYFINRNTLIENSIDFNIPINEEIKKWWISMLNHGEDIGHTDYIYEDPLCGGIDSKNVFHIFHKTGAWMIFSEWEYLDKNPYEYIMLNILNLFSKWHYQKAYK